MWIRRRMEKINWLDKVIHEVVIGIMNEDKQILNSVWKRNMDGLAMFWEMMDFCMKLLKAVWELNQQDGAERFKCYTIWQIMTASLHSSVQQRSEEDGGHREWMSNLLYSRRLLMDRFDHNNVSCFTHMLCLPLNVTLSQHGCYLKMHCLESKLILSILKSYSRHRR